MENRISLYTILLIFFTIVFIRFSNSNWGENDNYGILAWDNFGYYLYLPANFIYEDPGIEDLNWINNIREKYNPSSTFYQASWMENGKHVIQYSMGMSLIYSPAFFIAHAYTHIFGTYAPDGFSKPYQLAVLIYSTFILLLGLVYVRLFSLRYFSDKISSLIIIFLCLGTNYFQIAVTNTSTPHAILFSFYAILLYLVVIWHNQPNYKNSFFLGLLLAIMILSRPNELLFLIIPLFWKVDSFIKLKKKIEFLIKKFRQLILIGFIILLIGSLQLIYWKYTSGKWIFDSYLNEDFKLSDPYLKEYLFSYKKGWLLYTPIMAFALFGFISFYRRKRELFWSFFLFAIINVWILSSWDNWWYADSFSQRSIVQSYPIFILPIGYLLKDIGDQKKLLQYFSWIILSCLIFLNLFQTYQVKKGIIHTQRMSKEYYWSVFGETSFKAEKTKLLEVDRDLNQLPMNLPKNHYLVYHENFLFEQSRDSFSYRDKKFPKDGVYELKNSRIYSKKISFAIKDLTDTNYIYAVARVRYKSDYPAEKNPFNLVITTEDYRSKKNYKYLQKNNSEIEWFEAGSWSSMELVFISPVLRSKLDSIHSYVWLNGDKTLLIDNFSLEIYNPGSKKIFNDQWYINNFKSLTIGNWSKVKNLISNKGYSVINKGNNISSTLKISLDDAQNKDYMVQVSCIGLSEGKNEQLKAVIKLHEGSKLIFEKSFQLEETDRIKDWINFSFETSLIKDIPKNTELTFYIENSSDTAFFIDELSLKLSDL